MKRWIHCSTSRDYKGFELVGLDDIDPNDYNFIADRIIDVLDVLQTNYGIHARADDDRIVLSYDNFYHNNFDKYVEGTLITFIGLNEDVKAGADSCHLFLTVSQDKQCKFKCGGYRSPYLSATNEKIAFKIAHAMSATFEVDRKTKRYSLTYTKKDFEKVIQIRPMWYDWVSEEFDVDVTNYSDDDIASYMADAGYIIRNSLKEACDYYWGKSNGDIQSAWDLIHEDWQNSVGVYPLVDEGDQEGTYKRYCALYHPKEYRLQRDSLH